MLEIDEVDEESDVKPKKKVKAKDEEKKDKVKRKGKRKPLPATYEPGKYVEQNSKTSN